MERKKFDLMVQLIPAYFGEGRTIRIPDIQREDTAWTKEQKQALVDSLYNDFDIPKIYLRENPNDSTIWWLIDGQQRLTAINEFLDGKLALADVSTIPKELHNKTINDIPSEDKRKITSKIIDCIIVNCSDEEEEDMFLRLNNGTPLSASEKRNAIRGEFRDSVKELTEHKFFESKINFNKKRFAVDAICAQLSALYIQGGPTDIKGKALRSLYENFKSGYFNRKEVEKEIKQILDLMNSIFSHQEPYMRKANVISIFLFLRELKSGFAISSITPTNFNDFFTKFEKNRHKNSQISEDDPGFDLDFNKYNIATVNSSDSDSSVRDRHEVLMKKFFLDFTEIFTKDENRAFSNAQKEAIYFLKDRKCAGVIGLKCPFESQIVPFKDCEFDHIIEFNEGGKTNVENGQILCSQCHQYKTNQYNKKLRS